MLVLLLLALCGTLCRGHYDHEDWTDPTDMFNYDAATGKMIKVKPNKEANVEAVCEREEDACAGNNHALVIATEKSKLTNEEHKPKEDAKLPEGNSNPVFRRYLRKMLSEAERFGLPEDSSSEVYYNAEMVLSKQMVGEIQRFIDDEDWNLGAFEDAVIRTLVQFRYHNVREWWARIFEDFVGIDLSTALKILLCITCLVSIIATELWSRIGWFTQLKRLCIISFMVSVAWNWMYLYKVAFAERQAELAKQQQFDGSCGEKISWSESLLDWWRGAATFQNDPCEEYFKSLIINPALMVPPTKALALTFTDFITEPLKHVGKALGEFLNGLLAEIPVFYQLLVLILMAITLMVSCYGASTSIGQALIHRNHREPPRESLPPAEPHRPHYGNIEGRHPQSYYVEHVPIYRYPPHQRPESLQAMDVPDDRNFMRLPGFTDGNLPLEDKDRVQDLRKTKFTEQKPFREQRRKTEEPIEQISFGKHQRKEETRERSNRPGQREDESVMESSSGQSQSEEDPVERTSFTERQRKPLQKVTNRTQQGKAQTPHERSLGQDQIKVEPLDENVNGGHEREEEPGHERLSGQQQRTEDLVEEISHGEQSWAEGPPDDKSSELNGDLKRDSTEQRIDKEEESSHIAKEKETCLEDQQITNFAS